MSHITLANQGLAAVEAKRWDEAVTKLSKALQSSTNPAWLIARSKTLVALGRYAEALDDANLAWHMAFERNKRPLMVEAHYRRAIAFFRMGQLANADCCCIYAMRLIKGLPAKEKEDPAKACTDADGRWKPTLTDAMAEARGDDFNRGDAAAGMGLVTDASTPRAQVAEWRLASTLRMQLLRAMESLAPDDPARMPTVSMVPEQKQLATLLPAAAEETSAAEPATHGQAAPSPSAPRDAPLRIQDFQSNTTMSVSIFSKGTSQDRLKVEFLSAAVLMRPLVYPGGEEKELRLELWGDIDPASSSYTVTPNKVELSLAKKTPGKWARLSKDEAGASAPATAKAPEPTQPSSGAPARSTTPAEPPKSATETKSPSTGPAYPSSARTGPKNWDKIGADEEDEEDGADVNYFFKKLYKGATPEQQRAMMKSFTESNGTSLSTDWNDVKGRKVETVPPEGVEAKKWS